MDLLNSGVIKFSNLTNIEGNKFAITSDDPQVHFDFVHPIQPGWYKLECKIKITLPAQFFKVQIYFDFSQGFMEENSDFLYLKNGEETKIYFKINSPCNSLRLDLHESPNKGFLMNMSLIVLKKLNKRHIFLNPLLRNVKFTNDKFQFIQEQIETLEPQSPLPGNINAPDKEIRSIDNAKTKKLKLFPALEKATDPTKQSITPIKDKIIHAQNSRIQLKAATRTTDDLLLEVKAIFDSRYYLESNPDIKQAGIDPLIHFLTLGWNEARNPNKEFNTEYYLENNPDVKNLGINPLIHYIIYGKSEGRSINGPIKAKVHPGGNIDKITDPELLIIEPAFDKEYYLDCNPDVRQAGFNPLIHFHTNGWKEGRNPSREFNTNYYLNANPDVRELHIDPLSHYIRFGKKEGRRPNICLNLENFFNAFNNTTTPAKFPLNKKADILIPIYNGFDFLNDLFPQLKNNTIGNYKLILINDASPDKRIAPLLESQRHEFKDIEIITNSKNLGFVKSVNIGLTMSTNDVVILNSDTAVPQNWLARLLTPIWKDSSIASVTPMTNAGTIASFPNVLEDNDIFLGMNIDLVDSAFRKFNPAISVECPTGVGFCMAMSRAAIDKSGVFDQDTFGKGYGEENDWCRRAVKNGFKNILLPGLYVWHKHGGSFTSSEKKQLIERNTKSLVEKHPDYFKEVGKHISDDPLASFRFYSFIDLCCKDSNTSLLFFIDHQLGGGANIYLQKKIDDLHNSKPVALLSYNSGIESYEFEVKYKAYAQKQYFSHVNELLKFISLLPIKEVFYNNMVSFWDTLGFIKGLVTLTRDKKLNITVAIHDYYMICQSFTLLNNENKYCGAETNTNICAECIKTNNSYFLKTIPIEAWRKGWKELLEVSTTILCYSESSKKILTKVYSNLFDSKIQVIPHKLSGEIKRKPILQIKNPETHIGVIGNITFHKGAGIIKSIIEEFDENKSGKITVIGSLSDVTIQSNRLSVTGKYKAGDLPAIIEKSGVNIFLFPSIWPETFSYVTDELISLDVPLVAFNLGAPAERISKYSKGVLVNVDIAIPELIKTLNETKEKYLNLRIADQIDTLKKTKYFDKDFYLNVHSDIKAANVDPYHHFLQFGGKESRKPSIFFDPDFYLSTNTDVAQSEINPLIHFIEIGEKEGRSPIRSNSFNLHRKDIKINSDLKIAVLIHAFYEDLIIELLNYSANIPIKHSILLSVVSDEGVKIAKNWATKNSFNSITIKKVANRGRDMAPAFISFKDEIPKFDLICKIHSKKSLYTGGEQTEWRRQLVENLIGSEQIVKNILNMFQIDPKTGLVYPISSLLPYWAYSWLSNKNIAYDIQNKLQISLPTSGYIDYPMGSMFWFRPEALKQFTNGSISIEDFKEEPCGNDGTFAHGMERAIAYVANANGYNYIELSFFDNVYAKGYGSKNFYQYAKKTYEEIKDAVDSKEIISFDIFDTLISRPLITPDSVFILLELKLNRKFNCETNYFHVRKQAEDIARVKLNREVGYTDIYNIMLQENLLKGEIVKDAKQEEFEFELILSSPRKKMIDLYNKAIADKKRVILVSDMYLEKKQIDQLLEKNGIRNYSKLYLSSDVLKRKDNGLMWGYLQEKEKINPKNFIHIGDNEHSDIQLTVDKGLQSYHVMSSLNMFLNSTIGVDYVTRYSADWKSHLFLGPVINRLYNDPFIARNTTRLDPILQIPEDTGYCVFGPMILAYFTWICEESKRTNVDTLYFLAREGYLLKKMFDFFANLPDIKKYYKKIPKSVYLLTSRRSVIGAVDKDAKLIKEIIANNSFNGSLRDLLFNRVGVDFNEINTTLGKEIISIPNDTDKVMEFVLPYIDKIRENSLLEKQNLLSYLKEVNYTSANNIIALVDVGYSGTIQKYLHQLTKKDVTGYYFATKDSTMQWTNKHNQTFGFFENNSGKNPKTPVQKFHLYLEFWLTSPDGQLSHFIQEGKKTTPIFKEKGAIKKIFHVNDAIAQGVTEYLKDAVLLCSGDLSLLKITNENSQAIFEHFVKLDLWDPETRKIAFLEDAFCGNENEIDIIRFSNRE